MSARLARSPETGQGCRRAGRARTPKCKLRQKSDGPPGGRLKTLVFVGRAREDFCAFPIGARRDAGFQLDRVQRGNEPNDWKSMAGIGPGVREIRCRDRSGAFRVIYVASFEEAVYVLHAFQKKTQRTARHDIEMAKQRLRHVAERPL